MGAKVEIFVDGSPASEVFVKMVKERCCPKCEVIVHGTPEKHTDGQLQDLFHQYGIASLPAVTIDGKVVDVEKVKNEALQSKSV